MISLLALSFAVITMSFDKSTIKYPEAGRHSFSDDWIAGNGNFVKRISVESRIAMLGTIDATISRLLFPTLGNYGGAKNANSSRLNSSDWNYQVESEDGYSWTEPPMTESNGWPYQLMNVSINVDGEVKHYGYRFNAAERRDFSKAPLRITEINTLIDRYVLGDIVSYEEYDTIFRNGLCGEGFWLVPSNVKGAGLEIPVCQWTEKFRDFNPFTNNYALAIGELSKRGLGGSWRGARMGAPEGFYYDFWHPDFWNIAYALIGSPDWDNIDPLDVMGWALGYAYAAGETNESIRAENKVSIADLLAAHSDGIDYTSFTNRPTKRIWKERIAFANAFLAACRTKAIPLPRTSPGVVLAESNSLNSIGAVWKSPYHHFKREEYSGELSAKLRMTMDLGDKSFGINSDDGMIPLDLNLFKTESFTATNDYTITTNWAENLTCAWIEENANITVGGDVMQPVRFSDFGVEGYEILRNHSVGEWATISFSYEVAPESPYKVGLIALNESGYQIGKPVGPEVSTNWNGYIDLAYNGSVRGVECLDVGEAVDGYYFGGDKTQEELAEYSRDKTILPPQLNPISESLIDGITLNYVDVLGILTNRADVGGVAGGGFWVPGVCYDQGDPGQSDIFKPKDTWIYMRTTKLESKPVTKSEMDAYMVAMYDEAVGQLPSAYGLLSGFNDVYSPNRASSQMSEGVLQRVAQKIISGQGGVKMQPQTPAILIPYLRVRATSDDDIEVEGGEDQVIASFAFRIALSKSASSDDAPLRTSCAVGFWRQPHAIVEWNFPCMNYK